MITLTAELMKKLFPAMSSVQVKAFVDHQIEMQEVLMTPQRIAMCFANCYAETSGFALNGLTENIHYTAERMAEVWPRRFPRGASDVIARYGQASGWQNKAFDDIYGNRMGNRPGTSDGSRYIGRGGPQLTGLDEYAEMQKRTGIELVIRPELATLPENQPKILGAYWASKKLSAPADRSDVTGVRHIWNGGENGLDVVKAQYPRMLKALQNYQPSTVAPVVIPQSATHDEYLRTVQGELRDMGYYQVGEPDGLIGGQTLGAIKAFFTDRGITEKAEYPSQVLDSELNRAIAEGWHKPVSVARGYATEAEVAPKVESIQHTQSAGLFAKIGAWFGGVSAATKGAIYMMPDMNDQASPYIAMVKEIWTNIPSWVFSAIILLVCYMIVRSTKAANKSTVEDYQRGRIN